MKINELVTDEQLCFLALDALSYSDNEEVKEIALKVVVNKSILELSAKNGSFTEEEVDELVTNKITDHIVCGLALKGLVDEDIENPGLYSFTEKGAGFLEKHLIEEMDDDYDE